MMVSNPLRTRPIECLVCTAEQAATMCGITEEQWLIAHLSGETPGGMRLSYRQLWPKSELVRWLDGGAPDRVEWERRQRCDTGLS